MPDERERQRSGAGDPAGGGFHGGIVFGGGRGGAGEHVRDSGEGGGEGVGPAQVLCFRPVRERGYNDMKI